MTISTESQTRINHSESYRYQCPHCDAHTWALQPRVDNGQQTATKYGKMDDPEAPYYCQSCSTPLRAVYDKKREKTISVGKRSVNL